MTKISKLLLAVVALFAYSCATDTTGDVGIELDGQQTTIAISLEESRTHIAGKEGETYPLYWSEGDKIAVNGIASAPLAAEAHGKSSATFAVEGTLEYPYSIVYPAPAEGVTAAEGMQVVTFPAVQNYTPGTFAEGVAPMYGYVTEADEQIVMNHLAGIVCISVNGNGETLKQVSLTVASGKIAGNFDLNCETGKLTAQADATNVVTVDFGEGLVLGEEFVPVYIALPAGAYGICDIVLTSTTGEMSARFHSGQHPIVAGVVKEFNNINFQAGALTEPEGEYVITTAADLMRLTKLSENNMLSKVTSVRVAADIDMTNEEGWHSLINFPAITFDGGSDKGYEIKGLTQPLFQDVSYATLTNINLTDVNMRFVDSYLCEGAQRVFIGALARFIHHGEVSNCSASGEIVIDMQFLNSSTSLATDSNYAIAIAGLVGEIHTATSHNLVNRVNVTINSLFGPAGTSSFFCNIGGITGHAPGVKSFTECYNYGDINLVPNQTTGSIRIGGLLGYAPACASYEKCENYGDINTNISTTGALYVAGLIALPYTTSVINNCKNSGAINISSAVSCGTCYVGSIGAYNPANLTISNCTATNNAEGKGITIGCDCTGTLYAGFMGKFYASSKKLSTNAITDCTNSTDLHVTSDFSCTSSCYPTLGMTDTVGSAYSVQTISNFHVSGDILFEGEAQGYFYAASMMGYWRSTNNSAYKLTMTNCSNSGNITVRGKLHTRPAVGGIMAYNSGNYATLTDISNTGNITVCNTLETGASSWFAVGGITGYDGQEPPMTRCTNSGNITVTGYYDHSTTSTPLRVGGIVGYVASFAKLRAGAINSGNITIGAKDAVTKTDVLLVGGIWGQNTSASATMTDPINVGNIEVTNVENSELEASHIGGIVGKTYANVTNAQCYCNIYAQDYPKVGWATGSPRNTKVSVTGSDGTVTTYNEIYAKDCKFGGNGYKYNEEDEEYSKGALKADDFHNYIYGTGFNTDWTGTDNHDGCTFLTEKPAIN